MTVPLLHGPYAWLRDTIVGAYETATFLAGIRIVVQAAVPLVLGTMLHSPVTGLFGALGAMSVGFCDLPGSYRRRAIGLLAASLLLALFAALGTGLHAVYPWSLPALLLLGTLLGFAGTLTATAGKATTFALVMLILGDGIPGDLADMAERGLAVLAGGLWMTFGALLAWPLQPFAPARKAMRQAFADLAAVLDTALAGLSVPRPESIVQAQAGWQSRATAYRSLDATLAILTDLRAIRDGTSMTGRRLVLAVQQGRLIALSVAGLSQCLEMLPAAARPVVDPVVAALLRGLAHDLRGLGTVMGPHAASVVPPPLSVSVGDIADRLQAASARLEADGIDASADMDSISFSLLNLRAEVERVRESLAGSIEAGSTDAAGDLVPAPALSSLLGAEPRHVLLDNLSLRSQRLRHGLRVGAILAIATFAYTYLDIAHGYWVALVAVLVLKPGYGGTRAAGIARTIGTLIGGLIAAVLLTLFHGTLAHAILALLFATCAFGVIGRNLGLGTVLLTPFIVMLFTIMSPQGSETIWLLRIGDTFIGAILAFVGMLTLWPSTERTRIAALAAEVLQRHAAQVDLLLHRALGEAVTGREVRRRRQATTLAMTELDASWEQLLGEPRQWHPRRDRYYTLVSLVRLAVVQTGPLFTVPARPPTPEVRDTALRLAGDVTSLLQEIAAALTGGPALPDIAVRTGALRREVRDLERQADAARGGSTEGTALHLITGSLARMAETAVNLAQLTQRLKGEAAEPAETTPRFVAPG
ncbi:MAG: FUSC family protein [Sneathiellaceae bacterium]